MIRRYSRKKKKHRKILPEPCTENMSFQECELAILRQAVDINQDGNKKKLANTSEVKGMIKLVEYFLRKTKCICYGGTAINNILPKEDQFYDRDLEVPDYDFFSQTPLAHAKELADLFHAKGYSQVEAKAGVHYGTYKVFVNFIPMADITLLHKDLFGAIKKEAIVIDDILYTPPNYLRMSMFLELSRPNGDVSRWEKILKRLTLLNKHFPLKANNCTNEVFQRKMESNVDSEKLHLSLRDIFLEQRVVFFGGYATSLYSQYMPRFERRAVLSIPDFDVLHEDPEKCANIVVKHLEKSGFHNCSFKYHNAVGEVVPIHYEIRVGEDTVAFIYKPIACHNYNEIHLDGKMIRVGTIDTILSFYLAFLYTDNNYFSQYKNRLLCMAQFLFNVEQENRLSQLGLLRRYSLTCYGTQSTLATQMVLKAKMFDKFKTKRDDPRYEAWFLKYIPGDDSKIKNEHSQQKSESRITISPSPGPSIKSRRKSRKKKRENKTGKKIWDIFFKK